MTIHAQTAPPAMSTLNVWVFGTADGARAASRTLRQRAALAADTPAVVIGWRAGRAAPELSFAGRDAVRRRAPDAVRWGSALFDAVFLAPLRALDGGIAAEVDREPPLGLDRTAVNRLRDEVVPTASALVIAGGDVDRIDETLRVHWPVARWSTYVESTYVEPLAEAADHRSVPVPC
ncbi:hypothetical protein JCM18899A_41130 [Nocardioides sp. AN3]